jgi:hypothetical protein
MSHACYVQTSNEHGTWIDMHEHALKKKKSDGGITITMFVI